MHLLAHSWILMPVASTPHHVTTLLRDKNGFPKNKFAQSHLDHNCKHYDAHLKEQWLCVTGIKKTKDILQAFDEDDTAATNNDIFSGSDFLDLHEKLNLMEGNMTVMFSLDRAQLYQNEKLDTWIGIWIILDHNLNTRYKKKHVLPAIIVPGPNRPENIDSFMFRSFYHLSVLQCKNNDTGLLVWNVVKQTIVNSHVVFLFATADALGLVKIDGRVGHHGAHGCWIGCGMEGRHKPGSGHYFAAHLHPNRDNESQDFDFCSLDLIINPQQTYQADL